MLRVSKLLFAGWFARVLHKRETTLTDGMSCRFRGHCKGCKDRKARKTMMPRPKCGRSSTPVIIIIIFIGID